MSYVFATDEINEAMRLDSSLIEVSNAAYFNSFLEDAGPFEAADGSDEDILTAPGEGGLIWVDRREVGGTREAC